MSRRHVRKLLDYHNYKWRFITKKEREGGRLEGVGVWRNDEVEGWRLHLEGESTCTGLILICAAVPTPTPIIFKYLSVPMEAFYTLR